jgi:Ca-activated chloride channel family protein
MSQTKGYSSPLLSRSMDKTLTKYLDRSKIAMKSNIMILGTLLLTIAASGPQIGTRVRPIERKGVDLVIALDTSTSMDAEDVTPSRLAKSKLEVGRLIRNLKGDRVAIIVFAGTSHLYLPLTTDYEAALLFLNEIDSRMIPTQGTVLSTAMNTALDSFSDETDKFKVMMLISDGEDHDDQAVNLASKASEKGLMINTVGVGSRNGSLIPEKDKDNQKIGYKRDKEGKLITTTLNESILKEIATAGKGSYFWFSNSADSHKEIAAAIENMEKKTISTHEFSEYEDRYQIIAISSLFCFFIGFVIPTRKKLKI